MNEEGPKILDIHLPADPSFWPLAPGWWLVLLLSLLIPLLVWWLIKRQQNKYSAIVPQALDYIERLEQEKELSNRQLIRQLSELLKRTAMSLYGRDKVGGLNGQSWLRFLDEKFEKPAFSKGIGQAFLDQPYRKQSQYSREQLISLVRRWIQYQGKANV